MARVLQVKITLLNISPPVWRRVLLKESDTLMDLHEIIQTVMPWTDSHMHEFVFKSKSYTGTPPDPMFVEPEAEAENSDIKISLLGVKEGDNIMYMYDFGDGWDHQILIEKITEAEKNNAYPCCIKASKACPPEDCGGPWGYAELLKTISDKSDPEHESMLEWLGGDFDPEAPSLEDINDALSES